MFKNCLHVSIHADRLRSNVRWLQRRHPWLMPVIKADAYGHGAVDVARILVDEGVNVLAVGMVDEAYALRLQGISARLVALMGFSDTDKMAELAAMQVVPLVHSRETLKALSGCSSTLPVALKVDTGMGRLGFTLEELPEALDFMRTLPNVRVDYVLSHLASADDMAQDGHTRRQALAFFQAVDMVRTVYPDAQSALVNSPGLLSWQEFRAQDSSLPELPGDLVRPGLALYGLNPLAGTSRAALGEGLLPVMEAWAPVLAVHKLKAGQSASYGCTFTATHTTTVAVVAAGYADGLLRSLSSRGRLFVGNGFAPILGRVCMQMTVVDVTHLERVVPGDRAWVLGGPEGHDGVNANDLARAAGTIPYELLCLLGRSRSAVC